MAVFNSTLFNKAIFNTKFIPAGGGVSKRRFIKLPKQKMFAHTELSVSSNTSVHSTISFESKITSEIHSSVDSKISFGDSVNISSKLLHELYKPINSAIMSKDVGITVKGNINVMELNSNKMVKYNTIHNILTLLDE